MTAPVISPVHTATPAKPRRNRNQQIIEDFPAMIRGLFRYDQARRCWLTRSWTDATKEYAVHHRVTGTLLVTTCDCQGAGDGKHMCKHQLSWARVIAAERSPGAVITDHVTLSRARFEAGKAA